ncbi:MAG: energy transducer TonB, partial [Acetobacteraceae bacterium]|nr:energy transducer TonB [Acetobacteraceae bacterium]
PPSPPLDMPALPPLPQPAAPKPRPAVPQQRTAFAPMVRRWTLGQDSALSPRSSSGGGAKMAGPSSDAATQIRGAEALGADWRNMLSAWVEAHKYYPRQAIMNGEDGSPEVEVVVRRDGTVQSVELETRSGSQWLDLALLALFRGAHLPPFPENAREDQTTFSFTMHYILIGR